MCSMYLKVVSAQKKVTRKKQTFEYEVMTSSGNVLEQIITEVELFSSSDV